MNITQNEKKNLHLTSFVYQHENHKEKSRFFFLDSQTETSPKTERIKSTNNSMM